MARCNLFWPLLPAVSAALLLAACGGGEEGPQATPTGTAARPAIPGPSATATAATARSASPTATGSVAARPSAGPSAVQTPGPSPPPTLGPRVNFDMDPAGNDCPNDGTTDCTIASIQQCVSVPTVPSATFNVDVVITGLDNGFQGFNYNLYFNDTNFTLTRQIHSDPMVNLLVQARGSVANDLSADVPNPPGGPVFTGSPQHVMAINLTAVETTPPFTQGVLGRYEFTVAEGAASGLYDVTLERPPVSAYLDKDGSAYQIDPTTTGLIALGQACP